MIRTEMAERIQDGGVDLREVERLQLLGLGEPEDIAAACAFLISDMSKFIT